MRSQVMLRLKTELKLMAQDLKEKKPAMKFAFREAAKRGSNPYDWKLWDIAVKAQYGINSLKMTYRCHHIVSCLLRGRTMEQIENKNTRLPGPDQTLVDKLLKEYTHLLAEEAKQNEQQAVCLSA